MCLMESDLSNDPNPNPNQEEDHEEEEEEEFELCRVCLKDKKHWTDECPYLTCIPNPMEVTLGTGYDLVCKHCNMLGGHSDVARRECYWWRGNPEGKWEGRAILKACGYCQGYRHWTEECPKKDLLPKPRSLLEYSAEYYSRLAPKNCQSS